MKAVVVIVILVAAHNFFHKKEVVVQPGQHLHYKGHGKTDPHQRVAKERWKQAIVGAAQHF